MEEKGRSRKRLLKKRRLLKKGMSFVLTLALAVANVGSPLGSVYAGDDIPKEEFRIHEEDIRTAIAAALDQEGAMDPSELNLGDEDGMPKEYRTLFQGSSLYEIFPEVERARETEEMNLRIFLCIDADADPESYVTDGSEKLIFFYINESEYSLSARVNIDGYVSGYCKVSSYESAFAKEEVEIPEEETTAETEEVPDEGPKGEPGDAQEPEGGITAEPGDDVSGKEEDGGMAEPGETAEPDNTSGPDSGSEDDNRANADGDSKGEETAGAEEKNDPSEDSEPGEAGDTPDGKDESEDKGGITDNKEDDTAVSEGSDGKEENGGSEPVKSDDNDDHDKENSHNSSDNENGDSGSSNDGAKGEQTGNVKPEAPDKGSSTYTSTDSGKTEASGSADGEQKTGESKVEAPRAEKENSGSEIQKGSSSKSEDSQSSNSSSKDGDSKKSEDSQSSDSSSKDGDSKKSDSSQSSDSSSKDGDSKKSEGSQSSDSSSKGGDSKKSDSSQNSGSTGSSGGSDSGRSVGTEAKASVKEPVTLQISGKAVPHVAAPLEEEGEAEENTSEEEAEEEETEAEEEEESSEEPEPDTNKEETEESEPVNGGEEEADEKEEENAASPEEKEQPDETPDGLDEPGAVLGELKPEEGAEEGKQTEENNSENENEEEEETDDSEIDASFDSQGKLKGKFYGLTAINGCETARAFVISLDEIVEDEFLTGNSNALVKYLEDNGGRFSLGMVHTDNSPLAEGEKLELGETYRMIMTVAAPNGLLPGKYTYRFPNGVKTPEINNEKIEVPDEKTGETVEIGTWSLKNGVLTLQMNDESEHYSNITFQMSMDFEFTREVDPEEFGCDTSFEITFVDPTDVKDITISKIKGDREGENWWVDWTPGEAEGDILQARMQWTLRVAGKKLSSPAGAVIRDKGHYSLDNLNAIYFDETDLAEGITVESSDGHKWTIESDDLTLIKSGEDNEVVVGWEYTMPETVDCEICDAEIEIEPEVDYDFTYTSSIYQPYRKGSGGRSYQNDAYLNPDTDRAQYAQAIIYHGDGYFIQSQIVKDFDIESDGTVTWTLNQITLPGSTNELVMSNNGKYPEYAVTDQVQIKTDIEKYENKSWGEVFKADSVKMKLKIGNTEQDVVNVDAANAGKDDYAFETLLDNGSQRGWLLLSRCECSDNDLCRSEYKKNGFCSCWTLEKGAELIITYESSKEQMEALTMAYNGMGYELSNLASVYVKKPDLNDKLTDTEKGWLWLADQRVNKAIGSMLDKKAVIDAGRENSYTAAFEIVLNRDGLDMGDDTLEILDQMSDTLAYSSGSIQIEKYKAGEEPKESTKIKLCEKNGDFTVDYNEESHVLTIKLNNPGVYQYVISYEGYLVRPAANQTYTNSAVVTVNSNKFEAKPVSRNVYDFAATGETFMVTIQKSDETDPDINLAGATYGLYAEDGTQIAKGTTSGVDGKYLFRTNVSRKIIFKAHTPYYLKEIEAPSGYQLDESQHWFYFCEDEGGCGDCSEVKEKSDEGDMERISNNSLLKLTDKPEPDKPTETDPTEPTEPTETDPTEPTEPTETDPTEPTEPTNPTEPTSPTESTEPTEPTSPANPTEPAGPGGSEQPTVPIEPGNVPQGGGSRGGGSSSRRSSSGGGSSTSQTTTIITPDEVPLASLPPQEELTILEEEEVPLAGLPKTGDKRTRPESLLAALFLSMMATCGISRKRKEEE